MSPAEVEAILAIANGLAGMAQRLAPLLAQIQTSGTISDAQQAQVKALNDAFRQMPAGAEWKLSTES